MKRLFYGVVDDKARLKLEDPAGFHGYLNTLRGKNVEVSVSLRRRHRSAQQNNYYWGVIIKMLSDFTGHDPNEVHEAMKSMFLSYEDKGIRYIRSTSVLTTAEAEEYYEKIRRFAAESLDLYIPDPNEAI